MGMETNLGKLNVLQGDGSCVIVKGTHSEATLVDCYTYASGQ